MTRKLPELEAEPAQKVRKFKTPGGGTVTWTWDPNDIQYGYLRHWGEVRCTGCKQISQSLEWNAANRHAGECRQIP